MADNGYTGNPDFTMGKTRTNGWAKKRQNAFQLFGIERLQGGDYAPNFSYAVTGGGAAIAMTPTAGHQDSDLRFFKWVIIDGDGNEAFGTLSLAARTTAVSIDTSALNPLTDWRVKFSAERKMPKKYVDFDFVLPAGSQKDNPTGAAWA